MDMKQFNSIEDPIARAEAMRAAVIGEMIAGAIEGVRDVIKTAAAKLAAYARYRRTYDALSAMTERELDDIGISRADIALVARGFDPRGGRQPVAGDALALRLALAETFEQDSAAGEAPPWLPERAKRPGIRRAFGGRHGKRAARRAALCRLPAGAALAKTAAGL